MSAKRNNIYSVGIQRRYFLMGAGSAIASVLFASCTNSQNQSASQSSTASPSVAASPSAAAPAKTLKIGSRNSTSDDILKFIQTELAPSQGVKFDIVTIGDSVKINDALKNGEVDANLFQHQLFMNQAAKRLSADFVMLNRAYTPIFGLYSKKHAIKSADEVTEGSTIGISNDDSNQDRSLKFLKTIGLINLKDKADGFFTVKDVVDHPKKIKLQELDNYAIARGLDDLDYGVSYALILAQAKLQLDPILLDEAGIAEKKYAIGLATVKEKENDPDIQKLNQLLTDQKLKDFIATNFKGTILPSAF